MIRKFSFENYKAFEKGEIEIKPITILLGANSVGKSSIIQLLLLLQQTANANKGYTSALKLNGNFVNLGENINIFRGKEDDKPLILSFDFIDEHLYRRLKKTFLDQFVNDVVHSYYNIQIDFFYNKQSLKSNYHRKISDIFDDNDFFEHPEKEMMSLIKKSIEQRNVFVDLLDNIMQIKSKQSRSNNSIFYRLKQRGQLPLNFTDKERYIELYDFLKSFREIQKESFTIKFEIKHHYRSKNDINDTILCISKITLCNDDKPIITFGINLTEKAVEFSLTTPFIKEGKEIVDKNRHTEIKKYIVNHQSTMFSVLKKQNMDDYFMEDDELSSSNYMLIKKIFEILSSSISEVESFFLKGQINYVSPLRAYPKRFYSLDNASSSAYFDTLNGEAMVELLKANDKLQTKVNAWLKQSSLKSKLKVEVKQVQDIIYKLIVEQYGIKLDITDVGFGISQVLPILVQGFISPNNTLTMMEQPEVHLHPTMQADLADLFIEIINMGNGKKKQRSLLIETHSEYILNRLRRRIAEGDKITNDDIAIYAIERDGNKTIINSLDIPQKGNFKYPEDFYSGELFKDTMIFLKAQND